MLARQRMAWGAEIYCWPDAVGRTIARTGVYDLPAMETAYRLADVGETAVDVGANIGFMTAILGRAVGTSGHLISYEPHPLVCDALKQNVALWAPDQLAHIDVRQLAVSSSEGTATLGVHENFSTNRGGSSLDSDRPGSTVEVRVVRLDHQLSTPVGLLKIDIEGHELKALEGASRLLASGAIRDILLEEKDRPPTPVTSLLDHHGYQLFSVRQGLSGPILSDVTDAYDRQRGDPPAILATKNPERARSLMKPRGWQSLRASLRD